MSCTQTPCVDCKQALSGCDACVDTVSSDCVIYEGTNIHTSVITITANDNLTKIISELSKNGAVADINMSYNPATRQLCLLRNGTVVRCFTIADTGYYMSISGTKLQLWRVVLPNGPDVKVDEEDLSVMFSLPVVSSISSMLSYQGESDILFVNDSLRGGTFLFQDEGTADNAITFEANGGGFWVRNTEQSEAINIAWAGALPTNSPSENTEVIQGLINSGHRNIHVPKNFNYLPSSLTGRTKVKIASSETQDTVLGEDSRLVFMNPEAVSPDVATVIEALNDSKGLRICSDVSISDTSLQPELTVSDTKVAMRNVAFTLPQALGLELDGTPTAKEDGATTADISKGNIVAFSDTASTSFISFTNGYLGQTLYCWFATSNTTLLDSSDLVLGANITPSAGSVLNFYIGNDSKAYLVGSNAVLKSGTLTGSGDDSTTTFSVAHGVGVAPAYFSVTAMTEDAAGSFYVQADDTDLNVIYITPPITGTDNLAWKWGAKA